MHDGRRVSRQLPEGQTETWTYETPSASSHGRLVKHVDFKGQSTRSVYEDSAAHGGRVLEEWRYEAGQNASSDTAGESAATATFPGSSQFVPLLSFAADVTLCWVFVVQSGERSVWLFAS
jgi:hypothetical protein